MYFYLQDITNPSIGQQHWHHCHPSRRRSPTIDHRLHDTPLIFIIIFFLKNKNRKKNRTDIILVTQIEHVRHVMEKAFAQPAHPLTGRCLSSKLHCLTKKVTRLTRCPVHTDGGKEVCSKQVQGESYKYL